MNAFGFWAAVAAWSLRTGQRRDRQDRPSAAHLLLMERVRRAQRVATGQEASR